MTWEETNPPRFLTVGRWAKASRLANSIGRARRSNHCWNCSRGLGSDERHISRRIVPQARLRLNDDLSPVGGGTHGRIPYIALAYYAPVLH